MSSEFVYKLRTKRIIYDEKTFYSGMRMPADYFM